MSKECVFQHRAFWKSIIQHVASWYKYKLIEQKQFRQENTGCRAGLSFIWVTGKKTAA
jgi:hypothetical protein